MPATTTQNGRQRKDRKRKYSQDLGGVTHRVLDGVTRVGNATFHNTSRFFGSDPNDKMGSAYRQIVDLVFVLGIGASVFVSWYFAPAGYKLLIAPLIFLGLFTVEWGMHAGGKILVAAACTLEQKPWVISIIIVGGLFIFTDTILFIQSFTDENSPITLFLLKYTSFLTGGEAIVILLLYTKAMAIDERRNAVMYHNGATASGFMSKVQDALEHVWLLASNNKHVRELHRYESRLAALAQAKALTTRASNKNRKTKANSHASTMTDESMKALTRPIDQLEADLSAALEELNNADYKLPDFHGKGIDLPEHSKN